MGHHKWTITVYENGKFLLNLLSGNLAESVDWL